MRTNKEQTEYILKKRDEIQNRKIATRRKILFVVPLAGLIALMVFITIISVGGNNQAAKDNYDFNPQANMQTDNIKSPEIISPNIDKNMSRADGDYSGKTEENPNEGYNENTGAMDNNEINPNSPNGTQYVIIPTQDNETSSQVISSNTQENNISTTKASIETTYATTKVNIETEAPATKNYQTTLVPTETETPTISGETTQNQTSEETDVQTTIVETTNSYIETTNGPDEYYFNYNNNIYSSNYAHTYTPSVLINEKLTVGLNTTTNNKVTIYSIKNISPELEVLCEDGEEYYIFYKNGGYLDVDTFIKSITLDKFLDVATTFDGNMEASDFIKNVYGKRNSNSVNDIENEDYKYNITLLSGAKSGFTATYAIYAKVDLENGICRMYMYSIKRDVVVCYTVFRFDI